MSVPPSPPSSPPADNMSGSSFSLATLFVFITLAAVLLAGVAPLLRSILSGESDLTSIASMAGGLVLGCILGVMIGLQQFRWGRAAGIGALAGGAIGLLMGGMATLDDEGVFLIVIAMLTGSLAIVGVSLVMRPRS